MLDVETFLIFFYFVNLKFGSNGPGIHVCNFKKYKDWTFLWLSIVFNIYSVNVFIGILKFEE